MKVYAVTCTIYVTADNADHAESMIEMAIEPYAPDMRTQEDDPSIDAMYLDNDTREVNFTDKHAADAYLINRTLAASTHGHEHQRRTLTQ